MPKYKLRIHCNDDDPICKNAMNSVRKDFSEDKIKQKLGQNHFTVDGFKDSSEAENMLHKLMNSHKGKINSIDIVSTTD